MESLSAYARQFLERMEKPDVDDIDGIAPAVAIRQKNTTRNPRSTVATSTECFDFLRLLVRPRGPDVLPQLRHARPQGHGGRSGRAPPHAARGVALVRTFPLRRTPHHRRPARSPLRTAQEGLQPPLPGRTPLRILHPGIAAGYRFHQARLHPGGPPGDRAGTAPAPGRYHRDLLSRGRRSDLRERLRRAAAALQRALSVQDLRHGIQHAGADSVQLQLARGRLPALPGFRQHHRFRHEPRDSRLLALPG